jgi:hypothetical protein
MWSSWKRSRKAALCAVALFALPLALAASLGPAAADPVDPTIPRTVVVGPPRG